MQLSVIIVNYKVPHYLLYCLYSVKQAVATITAEILVVDNASQDDSETLVKQYFPEVIWLAQPKNIGFAKANNLGLGLAKGDYTLFLNPDTILPENALVLLIREWANKRNMGAAGVQMIAGNGQFLAESKREKPTLVGSFFKIIGLAEKMPTHGLFNKYALGNTAAGVNTPVPVLPGAFFMANTKVLQEVGGFDERYFMYGEDIDLSVTLQNHGLTNQYFGSIQIIHFKGESTVKASVTYANYFFGAMLLYVQKYYPKWYHVPVVLLAKLAIFWAKTKHTPAITTFIPSNPTEFWCIGCSNAFNTLVINCTVGSLQYAAELTNIPENAAIIWLLGPHFSSEKAIELTAAHKGKYMFYWYFNHAPTIIGSNQATEPGVVIPANKAL